MANFVVFIPKTFDENKNASFKRQINDQPGSVLFLTTAKKKTKNRALIYV